MWNQQLGDAHHARWMKENQAKFKNGMLGACIYNMHHDYCVCFEDHDDDDDDDDDTVCSCLQHSTCTDVTRVCVGCA